jgi:integrase/recombinase XerD
VNSETTAPAFGVTKTQRLRWDEEVDAEVWEWRDIAPEEDASGEAKPMPANAELDERWLALALLAQMKNTGSRAGYRRDINAFMRWWAEDRSGGLPEVRRPLAATPVDLRPYAGWLADPEQELEPATQARKLSVVSAFYELAVECRLIDLNPMAHVTRPTVDHDSVSLGLSDEESARLEDAALAEEDARVSALVLVLLFNGFRISEALGITKGDITTESGRPVLRIKRKGKDAQTTFPIGDRDLAARVSELAASAPEGEGIFGMDRFVARRALARVSNDAGLGRIHPHVLRHTFVTQLLEDGVPPHRVRQLAGHASLNTTMRYVRALEMAGSDHVARLRGRFARARKRRREALGPTRTPEG